MMIAVKTEEEDKMFVYTEKFVVSLTNYRKLLLAHSKILQTQHFWPPAINRSQASKNINFCISWPWEVCNSIKSDWQKLKTFYAANINRRPWFGPFFS